MIVYEDKNFAASDLKSGTGFGTATISISNGTISTTVASTATSTSPHEFLIEKEGDYYTLQDPLLSSAPYIYVNSSKKLANQSSACLWTISFGTTKDATITLKDAVAGKNYFIRYGTTAASYNFRAYVSEQGVVHLYKKEVSSCGKVSGVKAELNSYNTVKLSWTAPATAPANGYKVSINKKADGAEVVKDAPMAAGTTEYTYNTLTENTEYTYSIVSVCGEGDESQAVTGTFKTKKLICPQASNINAVTTSAFTLTWQDATANESATEVILAPEKYHIKITTAADAATAIKDEDINTGVQTYAYTDPTANTEYTYTFHSVCANNKTSTPQTDNFTPVTADTKTLNVSLIGSQENGEYTGAVTFTFATNNFTLGTDGKVKYSIIGDKQKIEETTTESSVSHDLLSGYYIAEFELVDMAGNSLNPKVSDDAEFTVDLPDVAAPAFSLAEQTAAFTEAQTLTLSCGTEGAKIYYAIGEADFTEYKEAINLDKNGTFTIRAFAAKEKMDTSATVSKTYTIKLPYDEIVKDLAALRAGIEGKTYKISSEVILTAQASYRNYKWIQDANAGILIDDASKKVTTTYQIGDGITGAIGKLGSYNGQLQLVMIGNLPEASSHNNIITPIELGVPQFTEGIDTYCSRVVKLNGLTLNDPTLTNGKWEGAKSYPAKDEKGNLITIYTSASDGDFVGSALPQGKFNLVGIAIKQVKNDETTVQITPRSKTDIEEVAECNAVSNVRPKAGYGNVVFSWDQVTPTPALGFAVEIFTADTQTSVSRKTTQAYTLLVDNLQEGEKYVYSITSLCATDLSSEAVVGTVTTLKKGVPHITIENPGEGREYVSSTVTFNYRVEEFTLGTSESDSGFVKYTITGERLAAPISDTCTRLSFTLEFEFSGNYTVEFSLVDKNMNTVAAANTISRNFIVNLPDVAAPVFAPEATALDTVTDVTLSCATDGATIYYSLNDADFTAYAQPIKLDTNGTYKFKAFAVKAKMDTSAVVSKTYTIKLPKPLDPGVLFYEPFDKLTGAGTGDLSEKLNTYTQLPGWSGEKVYMQVAGIAKMGTSKANGFLQTPAIELAEGQYILSFDAQAWNNDSDKLTVTINGTEYEISGLVNSESFGNNAPTQMRTFEKEFSTTSPSTTIRFASNGTVGKARFLLDNVKISEMSEEPKLTVSPEKFEMNTVQGTPVSQKVSVKGYNLAENVTVSVLSEANNFSVSAATLTKEAVMAENGAELSITFNGSVAKDSAMITLTSGELKDTVMVRAFAATVTEVNNIAALRAATQGSLYKIKGEVILTAKDTYRNYKWIEDESGAILIDDNSGLVTTSYEVGDGITGVYGKLGNYRGQLQLVMTGNLPEASSHNNTIEPQVVTVKELTDAIDTYCSRLVRINGLTLEDATGAWAVETSKASDESGTIDIYPFVRNGNFIGTDKPEGKFDLVALAGIFDETVQVSPRTTEDIIASGIEPEKDTVKTPVFTPASGTTLKPGDLITISCATDGAVIYYTLDGSTPTTASQRYTDGIKMNADKLTVKAFAVMDGMQDSKVAEASYTTPVPNEDKESLNVRIYPNPNNGLFFVEAAEAVRMEIFNLSGLNLRTLELTAGKTEINLPQSGIYFIRLSNAQATIVKRVVVR